MTYTILGPNLRNQSKGNFHVHRDGCADLSKAQYRGIERDTGVELQTKLEAAEYVYPRNEFEWDTEDIYVDDLWFAPCTNLN